MDRAAQPPTRPRGLVKRHRRALLTVALVVYTAALAVLVADELLDLGLWPTALERQARALIARFGSPDDADRRAAADEMVARIDPFVAIPELLRTLGHPSQVTRATAVACLRQITAAHHGYDPAAADEPRRAAIARWQAWWQHNQYRY